MRSVADVSDPFRFDGTTCLSISGGGTSAYMLRRVLDAHGGSLPPSTLAVFANTGKELPETLDFVREMSERWNVSIRWVEYTGLREFREVTHATASRNGEPFAALIARKNYVPNPMARICTIGMKIETIAAFMKSEGAAEFTSVVGLRYDEPRRVAKIRSRVAAGEDMAVPLADARITRPDVMRFWDAQPFRLNLQWWESNCGGCYLKGRGILERIERDRPGTLDWYAAVEAERGATFRPDIAYAEIIKSARRPSLPMVFSGEPTAASGDDCACTD